MPHVVVKFYPGRTIEEKQVMADVVAKALHETLGYAVENVSVAVEEVERSAWMGTVYANDIAGEAVQLVKPPGYGPLAKRT